MPYSKDFTYRLVPLTAIACSFSWSLHPWANDVIPEALLHSFKRSGILNPPSLIPAESADNYTILSGHRRVIFARTMCKSKELLCKCYHQRPEPKQCLTIIADDQRYSGQELSIAEKAQFLKLAHHFSLAEGESLEDFFPLLGLKKNPELLKNLLKLAEEKQELLQATHTGEISLQIYTELQRLAEVDRTALLDLFTSLQLGGGKQRRFLQQIRDCAFAGRQNIPQLLESTAVHNILSSEQLNIPQKTQQLGTLLQRLLQPRLHEAEEQFTKEVRRLTLPENYRIEHSPAFEKDEVDLHITFPHLNACENYLQGTLQRSSADNE